MAHGHSPGIGGPHRRAPDYSRAFAIGIGLNSAFVLVEAVFGFQANSLALIADAGHNLGDVLGLALAWGAAHLTRRGPTARLTYGLGNSTIWAAATNAFLLLVACGAIAWEAVGRMLAPQPVASLTVTAVAAIGVGVNLVSALLFLPGRRGDLNIRGAFLHLAADAAVSAAVVIAGLLIYYGGWNLLDPLASMAIVLVIITGVWQLLRESVHLALAGVPFSIDPTAVQEFLAALPGVRDAHDLHIWAISTSEVAMTVHLVMPRGHPGDGFLSELEQELERRFAIHHTTVQIESGETDRSCKLSLVHGG